MCGGSGDGDGGGGGGDGGDGGGGGGVVDDVAIADDNYTMTTTYLSKL